MAKPSKVNSNKTQAKLPAEEMNAPVKMIIARKSSADSGKKPSPKRNNHDEVTYTVTNDFKSLRSNDMRYSDYAVSSTTSNSNSPKNSPKSAQRSPKTSTDVAIIVESTPPPATTTAQMATTVSKCDILVSIPQSQMPKSPYSVDDEFENVSLAQLKTASKKSPPSAASTTVSNASESAKSVAKNVPKLKIELNSLKSRLSISKPKSAGVLQSTDISEKRGRTKQRKHSLDDVAAPLTDRLDLETYAKNIGLLPIEVLTPPESADLCDKLKYSPNASPLSSASSTTSSSNNAFPLVATTELATTTTFHKKRKKKHSKDSKEPKDSKRRRMHAEISSRPEEESLKMKVKLTTPHNHKSHKSESSTAKKNNDESRKSHTSVSNAKSQPSSAAASVQQATTLGEESRSINHLMMEKERTKEVIKVVKADETLLTLSHTHLLPKPYNNIKEVKLPASPPLPPSLFKTTPLNFNTLTVTSTTTGQSKPTNTSASKQTDLPKAKQPVATASKPTSAPQYNRQSSLNLPKPHAQFIVPNLPRRPSPGSKSAYTPSSIASASSKQLGMQLKRSASLDESYALSGRGKQPKLDAAQRKTLYSSYTNKPFVATSNSCVLSKFNDCVTNAQSVNSNGNNNSAVTITARPPGGMAQAQTRWQLPPYTPLQLPFHKPAVEIVRINSNQTAADLQAQAAGNASKSGRMMGPPLSMVRGKKTGGQQLCADALKSQPMAMSATTLGLGRGNPYRLSPPALVNLQAPTFPNAKKAGSLSIADNAARKAESLSTLNGGASDKQSQQSRISLREFRPMREHTIDLVNDGGEKSTVGQAADTTAATASATPSARECLEAALNKIKQNITSTTVQDTVTAVAAAAAAAAAKQQQLAKPTQMNNEDLQNLHLLSESATTREKIAIRSIQSYEKPLLQQSSLVRQQNASVRNIPNPSALAFRNMSTLPAVSSTMVSASATATNLTNTNSSTTLAAVPTTSSSTSPPTQKTLPTTTTATTPSPLSPGNLLQASATASNSALNATTNTITTSTRTMKKPTTIDQVAANLNMRASAAAAAEAHASKLNAVEDTSTQISSSTSSSAAAVGSQNNTNDCAKTTSPSSSAAITSSEPSASAVAAAAATGAVAVAVAVAERAKEEQANSKATNGADESVKAKVLPKSIGDDVVGVTTAIVTDVTSIKNLSTNNNNNNNNSKNNNNNSSNSNSSSTNVKYGVTTASVASD
ncbi:unnamed protein product [Ceratitis capitata]|uniref:(Mediterranean fruit fly) hypothetical protein n=1 Tax=Ceratitis capitata TaxID=7213 RepID=A0A811VLQ4_CERCA|nr:unnamed protein product [Ceratitis capitata]